MLLAQRTSKQDPPPEVVFDSMIGEQPIWWISVEGELEPSVVSANRPDKVVFASPFLWRPHDAIEISIEPAGQASIVHLLHTSDEPFESLEAAAIRHRWGEHIDRDMRDRFDCGGRPSAYETSLYRGDVADWSITERVLDRYWQAAERIPIFSRSQVRGHNLLSPGELHPGDIIWSGEFGRHRNSVGCLPIAPQELENRVRVGAEIFVPLPEFERRLEKVDPGA
jgi:hypothetical protein